MVALIRVIETHKAIQLDPLNEELHRQEKSNLQAYNSLNAARIVFLRQKVKQQ